MLFGALVLPLLASATLAESRAVSGNRKHHSASKHHTTHPEEESLRVRKEWSCLTLEERKDYTDAVTCIQNLPSVLDASYGSTSLFTDFTAVHINHTWAVHFSGYFLGWHRGYVRAYEYALQSRCGYKGAQPYWDWPKYLSKPLNESTLFDGSEYSLGSDGIYDPRITETVVSGTLTFPAGHGGGKIYSGPFTNLTTPYRSFAFSESLIGHAPALPWLANGTLHVKRNLNNLISSTYTNASDVKTALAATDISAFQTQLNGIFGTEAVGIHGAAHAQVGGQMLDFLASPGDPSFFVMHTMIDRMWTMWQAADPKTRQEAIYGTVTMMDVPPSANATLEDVIDWGDLVKIAPARTLRETMNVKNEWLGYRYE